MMTRNISYILAAILILNPVGALADSSGRHAKASAQEQAAESAKVKPQVEKAIYSLETIDDAVKDLQYAADEEAAGGFSRQVVRNMHNRITGAVRLISQILLDEKLSQQKKADYLGDLVPEFGTAMQKILRFQKEDTLNDPRQRDYSQRPDVQALTDKIAKSKVDSDERSDLQDEMIELLDKLDADGAKTRAQEAGYLKRMVLGFTRGSRDLGAEAAMDFKAIFTLSLTAKMNHVWTLVSRANRDTSSQDAVRGLVGLTQKALAKMDDSDPMLKKMRNYWVKELALMIRLRSDRLRAQRRMVAAYFGLAAIGFLFPTVDVVGLMDGGWSENSLWVSASLYAAAWSTIGAVKLASYSGRTVSMLKTLREMMANPKNIDEKTVTQMQKLSLWDRFTRVFPKDACAADLQ